ncbi:MAG: hypothetical protein SFV17_03990 [Candidatus Obscuribacter sp.]|nr:hypothetical protein [Candidatus Obscuribacter sp.]
MSNNRTDVHIYSAKQNGNAQSDQGNWVQKPQERSVEKLLPSKAPLTDAEAKQKFERLTELLESDESKAHNLRVAKELIQLLEKLNLESLIFLKKRT